MNNLNTYGILKLKKLLYHSLQEVFTLCHSQKRLLTGLQNQRGCLRACIATTAHEGCQIKRYDQMPQMCQTKLFEIENSSTLRQLLGESVSCHIDFAWLGTFVKVRRSIREWQRKPAKGIHTHHLDPFRRKELQ